MTISNIIAEVKTELSQYEASGMLDEISLNNWAKRALKSFGNLATTLQEKTIEVKNGKAKLPEGFYSFRLAAKCEPKEAKIIKGCEEDELVNTFFYRVRTETLKEWDNQSNKFQDGLYKEVVEKTYFKNGTAEVDYYFHRPRLLRLTNSFKKELCSDSCANLSKALTNSSPYEINILGDYIQTNFTEGFIYLQFYALEKDDNGDIIIPELSNDQLAEYITYHLKRKSLESIWISDDDSVQNKIQFLKQMEEDARLKAMSAAKIESVSGYGWWNTIQNRNKRRNEIYSNFTRK
jgi:hypothetical protein